VTSPTLYSEIFNNGYIIALIMVVCQQIFMYALPTLQKMVEQALILGFTGGMGIIFAINSIRRL